MMSSPWAVAVFVAAAALSLGASAILVVRLERVGARLGLSEALLGLVAALAADTPEVTSAVTALAHGQHDVGTGVVLGSNVFNLAALIGLGAVVAGGIKLHRRVVLFEGTVALWIAALTIAAVTGLITPVAALALALAVLAPYVYVSALHPSGRSALPLPPRLRSWLAGAVAEEEQELADAIHPGKGGPRDAAIAVLALRRRRRGQRGHGAHRLRTRRPLGVPGVITGAIVLAAVTSMPNAVAAVFLARRGRALGHAQRSVQQQHPQRPGRAADPRRDHHQPRPRRRPAGLPSGTASSPSPPSPWPWPAAGSTAAAAP